MKFVAYPLLFFSFILFNLSCSKDDVEEDPEFIEANLIGTGVLNSFIKDKTGNTYSVKGYPLSFPAAINKIEGGNGHYICLTSDGNVWAGGVNNYGQYGDSSTNSTVYYVQTEGISNVIDIVAGSRFSLALKADGTVWSWGYNSFGQLGDSSFTNRSYPVQVLNLSNVIAIGAGSTHGMAVKSDGTVWGWGRNHAGQLGDSNADTVLVPVQIAEFSNIKHVTGGIDFTIALDNDSILWSIGGNYKGQLGDGTYMNSSGTALQVSNWSDVIDFDCGDQFAIGLRSDSTLWSWGTNYYGQLGLGEDGNYTTPTPVLINGFNEQKIKSISVSPGGSHCLVIDEDDHVWSWGLASGGILGKRYPKGQSYAVPATLVK